MSINNVVLKDNYSRLLGTGELPFLSSNDGTETLRYRTQVSRQSLSIRSKNGASNIEINAKDGYVYLTNKRLVFITVSQGDINTFALDLFLAPVLQFSHEMKYPWFGANYWQFLFYSASSPSIASDGFPKGEWFEGKLYFNEGGMFEFIERINSALNDAVNNGQIDESLPSYSA